jgi:hypothetical protein
MTTPETLEYLLQCKILFKLDLLCSYRSASNITMVKATKSNKPEV